MNTRPKRATKKQCTAFIADPNVKRREDLDFFDVSIAYELTDGTYLLVNNYYGKGIVFANLDAIQEFRSGVSNSTEGEHILEGYGGPDDTMDGLVEKAISYLGQILDLPHEIFSKQKSSFKEIDKNLKQYIKQPLNGTAERNLVQAVISYLSATIATETGASLALKQDPHDKKYYPALELNGYAFNVATNVSDALLEYKNRFGLSFCYESQPMEVL